MERKDGRRELISLREVYERTRLRVGCYMFVSDNRWIEEAPKQETRKECNSRMKLYWQCKQKAKQYNLKEKLSN